MKTRKVDYGIIEYTDPWKAYKKGLVPLGLAEAYENVVGYNPLKNARKCYWLGWLRSLVWLWYLYSFCLGLVPAAVSFDIYHHLGQSNLLLLKVFGYGSLVGTLVLISTNKAIKVMQTRVLQTQIRFTSFMVAFKDIFDARPPSEFPTMESLRSAVTNRMSAVANSVLQEEVVHGKSTVMITQLRKLSEEANAVGLGQNWNIYFSTARKSLDVYSRFVWEI